VHRWSRYLVGVLEGLTEQHNQGRPLRGFSGLITSDVPTGAGISSSHSLVLAFMTGCLLANPEVALDPIQARLWQPPASLFRSSFLSFRSFPSRAHRCANLRFRRRRSSRWPGLQRVRREQ
jgi:hypothetical protein